VEEALKNIDGVQDFKVVIPPKDHAFVVFDPSITNEDVIADAITEIGYDVKEVVEKD
jgi:copper chaperone CopZ